MLFLPNLFLKWSVFAYCHFLLQNTYLKNVITVHGEQPFSQDALLRKMKRLASGSGAPRKTAPFSALCRRVTARHNVRAQITSYPEVGLSIPEIVRGCRYFRAGAVIKPLAVTAASVRVFSADVRQRMRRVAPEFTTE